MTLILIVVQVPGEHVERVHLIASDVGFEVQAGVLENDLEDKVIAIQPPVKQGVVQCFSAYVTPQTQINLCAI